MEFPVDPDHCVETVAKRRLEGLTRAYLRGEIGEECAEDIELLREFLSCADFQSLRSRSEELFMAGKKVRFFLSREGRRIIYGFKELP